jgi:hypothetical protein
MQRLDALSIQPIGSSTLSAVYKLLPITKIELILISVLEVIKQKGKIGTGGKKSKGKTNKVNQYHILVIRVGLNGELKNSKPCSDCIKFMKTFGGIRNIYYTDSNGCLVCEKLSAISTEHNSKGARAIKRNKINPV